MKEVFLSILSGALIGLIFKFIHLPLPTPPVLAGVAGVLGIYVGGKIFDLAVKFLFS